MKGGSPGSQKPVDGYFLVLSSFMVSFLYKSRYRDSPQAATFPEVVLGSACLTGGRHLEKFKQICSTYFKTKAGRHFENKEDDSKQDKICH